MAREAFAFTFAHLGAIIGVIWLPMAAVTVTGFFAEQRFYAAFETALATHGAPDGAAMLLFLAYIVLAMLFYAMMMVGVAQLVTGTRQPGSFVVSFGLAEWRLFRAWLGLALFLLVPMLVFMAGTTAMLPADPGAITQVQLGRLMLLVLVLGAALAFIGLRLTFLLPGLAAHDAAAVRGLLARAWTLSAGNFWRIFAVVAACLLPVYLCATVLEAVAELALLPPDAPASDVAGMIAHLRVSLPLAKGMQFFIAPFLIGLMASASVYAGRELSRTDLTV